MRAAMSEGDLSSWNVASAYTSRPGATHSLDFGLTYSRQEYAGGNPAALAAVADNSRNVGEVFAFDRWTVAPRLTVDYGGRYARYDYLQRGDLFSPRTSVSVEPVRGTRLVTSVAQRMVAPGAEEFQLTNAPGPWLPPERTFAPLRGSSDPANLRVERARTLGLGLEHEFKDASIISVQRFFQRVDDQLVTLFGVHLPDGPDSAGHYFVATAGGVEADGWAFRVSNIVESAPQGLDRLQRHPRAVAGSWRFREGAALARRGRSPGVPKPRISTTSRRRSRPTFRRRRPASSWSTKSTPATRGWIRRSRGLDSTRGSTCSSIRHCPSISPAPAGRSWSASETYSATPPIPRRSTTSSSSSDHRSELSAASWSASERHRRRRPRVRLFGSRFQLVGSRPGVSN